MAQANLVLVRLGVERETHNSKHVTRNLSQMKKRQAKTYDPPPVI